MPQGTSALLSDKLFGPDLREAPFRALFCIMRELGWKLRDRRFDRPVDQVQLLEPLESALHVAALHQPLDRVDRAVLMPHANEDGRIISPLLGQPNALIDEGLECGTGKPFRWHFGSISPAGMARQRARGETFARTAVGRAHFTAYAAKNIRTALSATSLMRAGEGAGSAWKTKGRNTPAWHTIMNCEAASRQSGIARSPGFTCASR